MQHTEDYKISWYIPGQIGQVCFVGKEVFAWHDNVNIYFHNITDGSEITYSATTDEHGHGIECFSGHSTDHMFVFAEISNAPRIFLMTYPGFEPMCIMKDEAVECYLAVGLTDLEQIVALSSYPNYQISVWCWRTNKKLFACDTRIRSTEFIFSWNLSQTLIFHGWEGEYYLWEIIPCYKICTDICRKLVGVVPIIEDVTWSPDGGLFCVDEHANIYCLVQDGMGMVAIKEWSCTTRLTIKPRIAYIKEGFVLYGPNDSLKYMTRTNKEWTEMWEYTTGVEIIKMIAGTSGLILCVTEAGTVLTIHCHDRHSEVSKIMFWQQNIETIEIAKPAGNTILSLSLQNFVYLWNKQGQLLAKYIFANNIFSMRCSPASPHVAMNVRSTEGCFGVWILEVTSNKLKPSSSLLLTDDPLVHLVWSESGEELATCSFSTGQVFFLKWNSAGIQVVLLFHISTPIFDSFLFSISKSLYYMVLSSHYDVNVNGFSKNLLCYKFGDENALNVSGKIEPTVARVLYYENHLLTLSSCAKAVNIYTLKSDMVTGIDLTLKKTIKLEHDIGCISLKCEQDNVITWGLDGVVLCYSSILDSKIKHKIRAKHYLGEPITNVAFDPQMRYLISFTQQRTLSLQNLTKSKSGVDSGQKYQEPEEYFLDDAYGGISLNWIQARDLRNIEEETKKWASKKLEIAKEFRILKKKLVELLEENILAPPLHQLPLNTFNLHVEGQQYRAKEAALDREAVRTELEEIIKSLDTVAQWVKLHCWDVMDTVERKIFAIFRSDFVENYPLFDETNEQKTHTLFLKKFREFEAIQDANLFKPWIVEKVEEPLRHSAVADVVEESTSPAEPAEEEEAEENVEETRESYEKFKYQLTGTSSHKYITPVEYDYPQLLTQTNLQMRVQANCIESNIRMLKLWFNKQFDSMMDLKHKELIMIEEKDRRLNFIISELNILSQLKESDEVIHIYISDPKWSQDEKPNKLIAVEEDEVDITPYISPSQVVIPPPEPVPKDDFKERALMIMMDGVLEKLWHEEIKKPVPKPECMLKENIVYNEDDLKEIFKYEKSVEFRNEEREKYNKMLRAEYEKLSTSVNETITRFNQKIKEFYLLKLKVEGAIGQEELKLMRLRTSHLIKMGRFENISKLEHDFESNDIELEYAQRKLQEVAVQSAECHASYESLLFRDRSLDKNFKSSFSESSSIIADLCYKYFKKRPKWQQRASMTSGVLYELAQACLTKEKPRFLHPECIDFLKALDQLDLVSNMPAAINNETAWNNMCKLRRMKIELEIKIKAVLSEMAEVEMASGIWHRRLSNLKVTSHKLTHDLLQIRHEIENATKNIPIQLVIKYGYVEVDLTGHEQDFEPAVLIKISDIDAINVKIMEAGQLKLKAMRATTNFKKNILTMEWEHAKLKMKIRHLEEDIYHLERLKVTKEVREYLHSKIKNKFPPMSNAPVERQIETTRMSFNNLLNLYMRRVEELEIKSGSIDNQIRLMDSLIANLKLKASEKHRAEDPNTQKQKLETCKKRMEILIYRSKLLAEVKKQYVAIVLLQTDLELQRLRTYPTLSSTKI